MKATLGTQSIKELEEYVDKQLKNGAISDCLDQIMHFVDLVINDATSVGRVLSSKRLDDICEKVSKKIKIPELENNKKDTLKKGTVLLATELTKAGGHGGVIKDFIRLNVFNGPLHILLTDQFQRISKETMEEYRLSFNACITKIETGSSEKRLMDAVRILQDLNPENLVLITHNQDSVSIVLALLQITKSIYFIHHADTHLCLGVTRKEFTHVDLHNTGFYNCRNQQGVEHNIYWPLTTADFKNKTASVKGVKRAGLITASSGRSEKYNSDLYLYDYCDVIPELLSKTRGTHFHIGPLPKEMEIKIAAQLEKNNINKTQFIHIPWVPSLGEALINNNVDIYISSFPLGGGKAMIETMAAGIPLIMHHNYKARIFSGVDLAYPEAFVWKTPLELIEIVTKITREDIQLQSKLSRRHYETNYSEQSFLNKVTKKLKTEIATVPELKSYIIDDLQSFLDEKEYINKILKSQNDCIEQSKNELINIDKINSNLYNIAINNFIHLIKTKLFSSIK